MTTRTKSDLSARFQSDDPQDSWDDILDSLGGGSYAARTAVTFASATSTLVTVPASAYTATTALSPFVSVDSADTVSSQVIDVDYLLVDAARD